MLSEPDRMYRRSHSRARTPRHFAQKRAAAEKRLRELRAMRSTPVIRRMIDAGIAELEAEIARMAPC